MPAQIYMLVVLLVFTGLNLIQILFHKVCNQTIWRSSCHIWQWLQQKNRWKQASLQPGQLFESGLQHAWQQRCSM